MNAEKPTSEQPPLGISQRQPTPESTRIEPTYNGASSLGAMLRDARQKRGLTPADLAGSLNLDLSIVEAIESNRLEDAPETLYIRAYLKHWGNMMNADPAPWLAALDAQAVQASTQPRVSARTPVDTVRQPRTVGGHRRGGLARVIWRLIVVVVLIAAAVALLALALPSFWQKVTQWLPGHSSAPVASNSLTVPITPLPLATTAPTEPTAPSASLPPPPSLAQPTPPNEIATPVVGTADGMADAQTNTSAITATKPTPPGAPATGIPNTQASTGSEPTPPAEPTASSNAAQSSNAAANTSSNQTTEQDDLKIAVTAADCWVEVRDAHGKRLIYDVLKKGSERSLPGRGPFTIVLGHANGVNVTWKGKPVTLGTPNSTTGVIRTTVGGS